jgi:hypothetical protein
MSSIADRIVDRVEESAHSSVPKSIYQIALDESDVNHVRAERLFRALAKRLSPDELVEFLMRKCYPDSPGNARVFYSRARDSGVHPVVQTLPFREIPRRTRMRLGNVRA